MNNVKTVRRRKLEVKKMILLVIPACHIEPVEVLSKCRKVQSFRKKGLPNLSKKKTNL